MKTIQTQVPAEVDLIITALAKRQMVSRAAIVRQLLVKAVAKAKEQEGANMSRLFLCRAVDPFTGPFGDYVRAASREAARARFFEIFGLRPFSVEVEK